MCPPAPLVFNIMFEIQTGTKGKKRILKGYKVKRKSSHTILICRSHDTIHKKSPKFYMKISRSNKNSAIWQNI